MVSIINSDTRTRSGIPKRVNYANSKEEGAAYKKGWDHGSCKH